MTSVPADFLLLPIHQTANKSIADEKEKSKKKLNQDPRMIDFVKKIVALQSGGNIFLASGNFETEEEYNERRQKILDHKF